MNVPASNRTLEIKNPLIVLEENSTAFTSTSTYTLIYEFLGAGYVHHFQMQLDKARYHHKMEIDGNICAEFHSDDMGAFDYFAGENGVYTSVDKRLNWVGYFTKINSSLRIYKKKVTGATPATSVSTYTLYLSQ